MQKHAYLAVSIQLEYKICNENFEIFDLIFFGNICDPSTDFKIFAECFMIQYLITYILIELDGFFKSDKKKHFTG